MARTQCVGPALLQETGIGGARLGLQQRVVAPGHGRVDVGVRRHDVVVAHECHRVAGLPELRGMTDEALEPRHLVVELRPGLRVAVGQVQASEQHTLDGRFDITRLPVRRVAGQGPPHRNRIRPTRKQRHAVPAALAHHHAAVPCRLERRSGELILGRLQLLQRHDVGPRGVQPRQKQRLSLADVVDVPGGDAHPRHTKAGRRAKVTTFRGCSKTSELQV
jgi:hypothetical protein